jgi:hypothetical protein
MHSFKGVTLALPAVAAVATVVGALATSGAALGADYFTHCTVSNGKARGYVTVTSFDSIEVNGQVTLYVFDEDGDQIDRDSGYEYEYIYHDTELVRETDVDEDAASCSLDVSGAVDDPNPPPPPPPPTIRYTAFCRIVDGEAQGWVTVHDFAALTIDGYVKFYVFDEDGDVIDDDSSYEYEYIYHDTELVDSLSVDDEARSCAFDVSAAIRP